MNLAEIPAKRGFLLLISFLHPHMSCAFLRRFHVLTGEEILQKLRNYPESLEVKLEYLGGIGIGLCHGGFVVWNASNNGVL